MPRFFIYVSDAKVDMLLPQIPERMLSKIAAEITVDVKILRVTLSQAGDRERSRFSRALAVTSFLEKSGMVDDINSSSMYVRAEAMPMTWGHIAPHPSVEYKAPSDVVMFFGEQAGLRVCLTGSLHHVIGNAPRPGADNAWNPGSFYVSPPSFYAAQFEDLNTLNEEQEGLVASYHRSVYHQIATENLSFVARVIKRWGDDPGYLVASPIWVSVS